MQVLKKEIEDLLRCEITDEQFQKALTDAIAKQGILYQRERDSEIMQHGYLVELTAEYVSRNAFAKFTLDLYRAIRDMEKEHRFNEHGAPTDNHILSVPAL